MSNKCDICANFVLMQFYFLHRRIYYAMTKRGLGHFEFLRIDIRKFRLSILFLIWEIVLLVFAILCHFALPNNPWQKNWREQFAKTFHFFENSTYNKNGLQVQSNPCLPSCSQFLAMSKLIFAWRQSSNLQQCFEKKLIF